MPRLSLAEVEHVALLARLRLTDDEKARFTEDLNVILEHFEALQQAETEGVPPMSHAMPMENVFREDQVRPSLPREEFIREAPEARDEFFVVPRVVAGTLMFPIIVGIAMIVGVSAGWVSSVLLLDLSSADFVKGLRLFFTDFDVRYGLVKSASFGAAVTLIGCMHGIRARGGAQGVGQAATRAVVYSATMILVLDAFWAMVLL